MSISTDVTSLFNKAVHVVKRAVDLGIDIMAMPIDQLRGDYASWRQCGCTKIAALGNTAAVSGSIQAFAIGLPATFMLVIERLSVLSMPETGRTLSLAQEYPYGFLGVSAAFIAAILLPTTAMLKGDLTDNSTLVETLFSRFSANKPN